MNMAMHPSLNEQELLNDLLNQEKEMAKNYGTYITETSCTNMRQILQTQMVQTCQDQYNVFDKMQQKGYYQTKDAQEQDVTQAKQKFQQVQSCMTQQ